MQKGILKEAAAGLVTASLAMAMAPVPLPASDAHDSMHFINDRGELMTVDAPSTDRKPIYVAIPLRSAEERPAVKSGSNAMPSVKP